MIRSAAALTLLAIASLSQAQSPAPPPIGTSPVRRGDRLPTRMPDVLPGQMFDDGRVPDRDASVESIFGAPDDHVVSPSDQVVTTNRLPLSLPTESTRRSEPTDASEMAAQIRLARAQQRAANRAARLEAMAWQGQTPLRPSFHAIPMTTSRYRRPTIFIPILVP